MKKHILRLGISMLLVIVLSACSGEMAGEDSGGPYDIVRIPIPTDTPAAESSEKIPEAEGNGAAERSEEIPEAENSEGISSSDSGEAAVTGADRETLGEQALEASSQPEENILTITVSAAGDCSLGNHQDQEYAYSFRQAYDQVEDEGFFFQNVQEYFSNDDMTIVNLEGVLTYSEERDESRTYNIKGDPEYARLLTAGHIEAVSFANNHRLDYGTTGSDDTVEALAAADIVYAYDRNVGIYETEKGIRIGYVSVNEVAWGLGSEQLLAAGIEKLREEGADLILACCHWGIERENYPTENQQYLGRKCIDLGADLVIGHHPHVLQGVEEYNGKFIIYSLANFCFGANRNPVDKDTMIFRQTFTFIDGVKQEDRQIQIIPCSVSSLRDRNNFQPTPAQGEEAARIIDRINTYSADYGVVFAEDGTLVQ